MNKEEYYKRIERINDKFKTDRVGADEEYRLVCQRNYLSTKYIEHLEQQCKKQKEVINKAIEYINSNDDGCYSDNTLKYKIAELNITELLQILKGEDND